MPKLPPSHTKHLVGKQYDSDDDSDDLREKLDEVAGKMVNWQERALYWEEENQSEILKRQTMRNNHIIKMNQNNFGLCKLHRKADKYQLQKKHLQE